MVGEKRDSSTAEEIVDLRTPSPPPRPRWTVSIPARALSSDESEEEEEDELEPTAVFAGPSGTNGYVDSASESSSEEEEQVVTPPQPPQPRVSWPNEMQRFLSHAKSLGTASKRSDVAKEVGESSGSGGEVEVERILGPGGQATVPSVASMPVFQRDGSANARKRTREDTAESARVKRKKKKGKEPAQPVLQPAFELRATMSSAGTQTTPPLPDTCDPATCHFCLAIAQALHTLHRAFK